MLAIWITCIVVLPVLALVFYVVRQGKPSRFRLSASLLKLVSINIEVDAQDKPNEPPGTSQSAGTPVVGRQAASPAPAELPGLGHLGCAQRLPQAAYDLVCSPQGPPGGHDQHGLSGAPGRATVSRRVAFVTAQ